jgi:protein-arginine kinase activator protein McsA
MNITKFIDTNLIFNGKLVSKRCRGEWFISNKYGSVYDYIIDNTNFLNTDASFIQRIWHLYNDIDYAVLCKSDNATPVKFKNFKEGYYTYSSNKAAQTSEDVKSIIRKSNQIKYGVDSYTQTDEFKKKATDSWLINYGVDNPSKSKKVHDKKVKTSIKNYGTEYPIQSKEIKNRLVKNNLKKYGVGNVMECNNIKARSRNTRLKIEYGRFFQNDVFNSKIEPMFDINEYDGINTEYRFRCKKCGDIFDDILRGGKIPRCYKCYPNNNTSIAEIEIGDYIKSLGVDVIKNERNIIDGLEIDIWIPSLKIGIEYNGLYYHSEIFGNTDKLYHLDKLQKCEKLGIRLINIFEDEWISKPHIVKSKLKHILGMNSDKIYGRNCNVISLTSNQSKKFLETHHIQGSTPASIKLGLVYDDVIVAAMTFSKRAIFGNTEWEIVRYATNGVVIGGFGKLLSFFEKKWKPNILISYMNKNWSSSMDNVYLKNGFECTSVGTPNFFIVKNGKRYSRISYQKHKLNKILKNYDDSLTAWENLQLNGYDRIWDCGSVKYEKKYVFK